MDLFWRSKRILYQRLKFITPARRHLDESIELNDLLGYVVKLVLSGDGVLTKSPGGSFIYFREELSIKCLWSFRRFSKIKQVRHSFYFHYCIAKLIKSRMITICYSPTINTDDHLNSAVKSQNTLNLLKQICFISV